MSQCDPSPAAANTCPGGYHCAPDGFCDALCTPTGNECGDGYVCTPDGRCQGEDECVGLQCNIVNCQAQGKPETTIKGTVFAPNGTLPLYNINVYVPNEPLPPFNEGAECSRCNDNFPGSPIVRAVTDEAGNFVLSGVPSGTDIPLVITSGKWRRQIKIPTVAECADTQLAAADTRLPKNKSEGDIPRIALSTGNADSLECLLRRIGIADSEIGTAGDDRRIHLYDSKDSPGRGVPKFAANFGGGSGNFADSKTLWNNVNSLKPYDIVILSCEGGQYSSANKSQDNLNAMQAYADLGGRVFASHWHNIWISGNYQGNGSLANPNPVVQDWRDIATWTDGQNFNQKIDVIDEINNPKGASFATWMLNVMGSTVRGEITVNDARATSSGINNSKAERWTYLKDNPAVPQNFQFTTPVSAPADQKCGKVVYSDMHVSGNGGNANSTYPNSCGSNLEMSAQEKALAFMIFDLASCVGVLL